MKNDGVRSNNIKWSLELECKPDFDKSMERIYAWYEGEVIDRAPVRFSAHNDFMEEKQESGGWDTLEQKWFDSEYQVDRFIRSLKGKSFLGETFPVFWPNLGPNVYAAFHGSKLIFGEETSWTDHFINDWESDFGRIRFDMEGTYMKKMEELTCCALEKCRGKFMVGYTDLHMGLDCVAAWRGTQNLLFDILDEPEWVKKAVDLSYKEFQRVYDHFDSMLKANNQLSVTWMGIPSFGKMHIPSCDFSSMISSQQFNEFCLPNLREEVRHMSHNIFHLDGKDVARHLDAILEIPEIQAIQWVQGPGQDAPIMQWIPLIKRIRAAGKSVVVDLLPSELEDFMSAIPPKGILLCLPAAGREEQEALLKRIEKW